MVALLVLVALGLITFGTMSFFGAKCAAQPAESPSEHGAQHALAEPGRARIA
jgi:hypothetical protein